MMELQTHTRETGRNGMEAKTGVKKQVQTLNFRQWMRLTLCISPHSGQPVHMRRGFGLVAGMGLFCC